MLARNVPWSVMAALVVYLPVGKEGPPRLVSCSDVPLARSLKGPGSMRVALVAAPAAAPPVE